MPKKLIEVAIPLAIVEMDGEATRVLYLKKPFCERPDFAATSGNYDITNLLGGAEIEYEQ